MRALRKGRHMGNVGRTGILTWFWWENLKEKDNLKSQGVKGITIVKWN
jgi:hypothetical protein